MTAPEAPNTWFIGDSVLSRHNLMQVVRILPQWPKQGRRFLVTLHERNPQRTMIKQDRRDNLIDALRLGEEWLP